MSAATTLSVGFVATLLAGVGVGLGVGYDRGQEAGRAEPREVTVTVEPGTGFGAARDLLLPPALCETP
jgi:hypothetical protein